MPNHLRENQTASYPATEGTNDVTLADGRAQSCHLHLYQRSVHTANRHAIFCTLAQNHGHHRGGNASSSREVSDRMHRQCVVSAWRGLLTEAGVRHERGGNVINRFFNIEICSAGCHLIHRLFGYVWLEKIREKFRVFAMHDSHDSHRWSLSGEDRFIGRLDRATHRSFCCLPPRALARKSHAYIRICLLEGSMFGTSLREQLVTGPSRDWYLLQEPCICCPLRSINTDGDYSNARCLGLESCCR